MSDLPWERFSLLPGGPERNWELLCRELVRRNYAQFGDFRSLSQQPGVEFHLRVGSECFLGSAERHWGWQCRWYDLQPGRQLGSTRKKKIERAIKRTQEHVPGITDWVLWTRHQLTPTDQEWFYGLGTPYKLHLWAEEEVVGHLAAGCAILRSTYFGELVLTHSKLSELHELAMAPIRERWDPAVHVEVDSETELRAALGVPGSWPQLETIEKRLARCGRELGLNTTGLRPDEAEQVAALLAASQGQQEHLERVREALNTGQLSEARASLGDRVLPTVPLRDAQRLAVKLRSVKHPAGLSVADAIPAISSYCSLLREVSRTLDENYFVVVAGAGYGKTYLSAELTQPTAESPGGVLLHGKRLCSDGSLDDLARTTNFGGETFDELLEAVDAAGARLDRKLPIVIDGLNEAERPSKWEDLLAELSVRLKRYPNTAIVVTSRPRVADDCAPRDVRRFQLSGFEHNRHEAVRKYFSHYNIQATFADLPLDQLASPLFLRIFCEATNPDRASSVDASNIPRSQTAVFQRYRDTVVRRVAKGLVLQRDDVASALETVAQALWEQRVRTLDFDELRRLVGDSDLAWENSLARALEEEGLLTRDTDSGTPAFVPGEDTDLRRNQVSAILYDQLAGFLIAERLIAGRDECDLTQWLNDHRTLFDGGHDERHPLGDDVFVGLVGLAYQSYGKHLWEIGPDDLKDRALFAAMRTDPDSLDVRTRDRVAEAISTPWRKFGGHDWLMRLRAVRLYATHPLNADWLSEVLSGMGVAERDLCWSEWLRHHRESLTKEIDAWTSKWVEGSNRGEADRLTAVWFSWMLTSTVGYLRDKATQALYRYGVEVPGDLFELALARLGCNDPYVSERLLAAAYGVVMGNQVAPERLTPHLDRFVKQLFLMTTGPSPSAPTNHRLARTYIQGIVDFARTFSTSSIPEGMANPDGAVQFAAATFVTANDVKSAYEGHVGMDFENYEVGSLFESRRNYDDSHPEFSSAIKEIRGRIWDLGYRTAVFEAIDSDIKKDPTHRYEPAKTERYAKKYGWIGLYEKAGAMENNSENAANRERLVDIDPSFPQRPARLPISLPDWLGRDTKDDQTWFGSGTIEAPDTLLRPNEIDGLEGPWVVVQGYLSQTDDTLGRKTFGLFTSLAMEQDDVERSIELLNAGEYLGNDFVPREPNDHWTFAGEIPWSQSFAHTEDYEKPGDQYFQKLGGYLSEGPIVEILGHRYSWEDYHSVTNRAGGCSVPSRLLSARFGLRSARSSFDQHDTDGNLATVSRSVQDADRETGDMLYVREDYLERYLATQKKRLVLVAWGERQLLHHSYQEPSWLRNILNRRGYLWQRVITLEDLQEQC